MSICIFFYERGQEAMAVLKPDRINLLMNGRAHDIWGTPSEEKRKKKGKKEKRRRNKDEAKQTKNVLANGSYPKHLRVSRAAFQKLRGEASQQCLFQGAGLVLVLP